MIRRLLLLLQTLLMPVGFTGDQQLSCQHADIAGLTSLVVSSSHAVNLCHAPTSVRHVPQGFLVLETAFDSCLACPPSRPPSQWDVVRSAPWAS